MVNPFNSPPPVVVGKHGERSVTQYYTMASSWKRKCLFCVGGGARHDELMFSVLAATTVSLSSPRCPHGDLDSVFPPCS